MIRRLFQSFRSSRRLAKRCIRAGRMRGETGRNLALAIFAALSLLGSSTASFAQAPPPVPALPDTERRTSYSLTSSTCACSVGFQLYGDSNDFANWVEVWLNGVRVNFNDATFGWTITSPTGPLSSIPRPVTDGVLTFTNAQTGTVQIVGARRPRRVSQFTENRGVAARDLNQALTDIIAQNRETWDKTNDFTGRGLFSQPGNTLGPLPLPSVCAGAFLGFDGTGLNPQCKAGGPGSGNVTGPVTATPGDAAVFGSTPSQILDAGSPPALTANNLSDLANKSTARTNLNPTPTRAGDIVFWNGSAWVNLPGNNSGTQTLTENASGVPSWALISTGVTSFEGLNGAVAASSGDKRVWVSTAGNDSNTGLSPQSAKLTLQAAINAANPGGVVYVGAGTYTLTSTLAMQPGVSLACPQAATITQGNAQNLANLIDFTTNTATGASIYGCTIDGNRANNSLNLSNNVVNIGSVSNVTLDQGFVVKNGVGQGIFITTGTNFRIKNGTIQNNVYAGINVTPRASSTNAFGEVAGNQFLQVGGHAMIFDGSAFNKVHDNTMAGTLVTGLTVNISGTTVTITGGGTFSNTCSLTTICPGDFVISASGATVQESFITSITSSTIATSSAAGTTVTGATAIAGTGDMIDVATGAGNNDFYSNSLQNASGGGFVDTDEGDAGNFGNHAFNSYRGNTIQNIGGNCISIQQVNASNAVALISFLGNKLDNCLFGGVAIYTASEGTPGAITFFGPHISSVVLDGNLIYDTQGSATTPYWLTVGSTVPTAAVFVGKNTNQGMVNPGIFGAISSILLGGWGTGATTSGIVSNGDSFTFTTTAGTGTASAASATVTSRVTSSENPPQPQCKHVNGSANIVALASENTSSVGSTIFTVFGTPTASATYTINCHL
jgi:hypothetical protein